METAEVESTAEPAVADDQKKQEESMRPTPVPGIVQMYGLTQAQYMRHRSLLRDLDYYTIEEAKEVYGKCLGASEWKLVEKAMETYRGKR